MSGSNPFSSPELDQETNQETELIPRYKVIFHNDSVTSFEFVIAVLVSFFGKDYSTAETIAYHIHNNGIGIAGIYPLEVAQLKQQQTIENARMYHYPLVVTLEKA